MELKRRGNKILCSFGDALAQYISIISDQELVELYSLPTHSGDFSSLINIEFEVQVERKVRVPVQLLTAMNCSNCEETCHVPCHPIIAKGLCPAFFSSPSSVFKLSLLVLPGLGLSAVGLNCNVCTGKCSISAHENEDTQWGLKKFIEKKTQEDVRKRYEKALQKKLLADEIIKALENDLEKNKSSLLQDIKSMVKHRQTFERIALHEQYSGIDSASKYIELRIKTEEEEKKTGYLNRMQYLKDIKKKADSD